MVTSDTSIFSCSYTFTFIFILLQRPPAQQQSETQFFSKTCQEANAMFIVLFRSFLGGLELNLNRHMLRKKLLNCALCYDFEIFKGMSHNLELLSFQKMYGLLEFIRKMKVLQRSARGRS